MGLSIILMDCNGTVLDRIDDPKNFLHKLLPPSDEESAALLTKIDWYGDTYFNYLQIRQFLAEWSNLKLRAATIEEHVLLDGAARLAKGCRRDRNLLRFVGD